MDAVQIENTTRGCVLVDAGRVADNPWTQLRGLIGSKPLQPGQGMLFPHTGSIHTHFMGYPIDVLYLDKELTVVGVEHAIRPWRFGRLFRGVRCVLELPAGVAAAHGVQVGDRLLVSGYSGQL